MGYVNANLIYLKAHLNLMIIKAAEYIVIFKRQYDFYWKVALYISSPQSPKYNWARKPQNAIGSVMAQM